MTAEEGAFHISIPLTTEVQKLMQPIRVEAGLAHRAGTVSYCTPGSGFELVLSIATMHGRDARCTAFGTVDGLHVFLNVDALIGAETVAPAASSVASR